ncbi:MAG: ABC transporter substrate-binding protein [Armatimonadota bacterium]
MSASRFRRMTLLSLGVVFVALLVLVSASYASSARKSARTAFNPQTAQSAQAFGSMAALVKAAQKEGTLNVIALPPTWADYGKIISAFQAKYHIKIVSANPDGNSQQEVDAVKALKGTNRQPDVVDLAPAIMAANLSLWAPYKVAVWNQIPKGLKAANALWYDDYTGYEAIGYSANIIKTPPKTMNDLLKSIYKGKVALNGNPLTASAALNGVVMASIANGGSANSINQGVTFFHKLKAAGNLLPVDPTPASEASGQTPIVIDWDYNHAGTAAAYPNLHWKWVIPANDIVTSYYQQAIVKNCPHPAAARLWEEFIFSTTGQNWFLRGGAHPVLQAAMTKAGTIDKAALKKQPKVVGTPVQLSPAQLTKAVTYLQANWGKI